MQYTWHLYYSRHHATNLSFMHIYSAFKLRKSKRQCNVRGDILDGNAEVNFIYLQSKEDKKDENSSLKNEKEKNECKPVWPVISYLFHWMSFCELYQFFHFDVLCLLFVVKKIIRTLITHTSNGKVFKLYQFSLFWCCLISCLLWKKFCRVMVCTSNGKFFKQKERKQRCWGKTETSHWHPTHSTSTSVHATTGVLL